MPLTRTVKRATSKNLNPNRVDPDQRPTGKKVVRGLPPSMMLRHTKKESIERAKQVKIIKRYSGTTKSGVSTLRFVTKSRFPKTANIPPEHDTIVKWVGPDRVWVHCGCLIGSTRVLTDKGWQTIHELIDPDQDPRKDFTVAYNINGEYHKGSTPFFKGQKPVWEVICDNGYSVTGTKDHKVLVYRGRGSNNGPPVEEWVEIGDLEYGDRILVHADPKPIEDVAKDRKFWESYFIGAFLGDGTLNPASIVIHSHPKMKKLIAKAGVKLTLSDKRDGMRYLLCRRGKELLAKYGLTNDRFHVALDKLDFYGLVSGLIDSDGVCNKGSREAHIIGSEWLYQIADEMIARGWHGVRMRLYREKGVQTNKGVAKRNQFYLYISSKQLRAIKKNLASLKVGYSVFPQQQNSVLNWARVEEKIYRGRQYVYDIHVPKVHRFVAEGFIVHNCEDFMYRWEYALSQYGASSIINGNGEPAVLRNPANIPGLCLHLYKVLNLPSTMDRLEQLIERRRIREQKEREKRRDAD